MAEEIHYADALKIRKKNKKHKTNRRQQNPSVTTRRGCRSVSDTGTRITEFTTTSVALPPPPPPPPPSPLHVTVYPVPSCETHTRSPFGGVGVTGRRPAITAIVSFAFGRMDGPDGFPLVRIRVHARMFSLNDLRTNNIYIQCSDDFNKKYDKHRVTDLTSRRSSGS